MKLMQKGLIVLFSVILTACGGISSYMDVSDKKLEGEGITLSETIKTKDLYGAWAFATEDKDPNDITLIFALYTDHTGLAYGLDIDRKTKVETASIEQFTWKFNETNKELDSVIFKQIESIGDKRTEKTLNKKEQHKVDLYRLDNEKLAIKLVNKEQRLIFFRMPNSTYNKLVQDRRDLPRLK
jgi:plasmid maintenance system killer protein